MNATIATTTLSSSESTLAQITNQQYMLYKDAGFLWALFQPALIYFMLAIVGIPMNLSVCYITIKYSRTSKSIGSKTGILIALNSFYEILHQSSHFFYFFIAATGINYIPIWISLIFNGIPLIGFCSSLNMLTLSLDRLFAVLAPISYHKVKKMPYVMCHLALIIGYNLYMLVGMIGPISRNPNWPVTGFIGDLFSVPDVMNIFIIFITFTCYASVFFVYLLVGILVKCRVAPENSQCAQKLYRSLCLIVFFNVGGYVLGCSFQILIGFGIIGVSAIPFVNLFGGAILNLSAMSNGPILFLNSLEYRKAYQKEFGPIKRVIAKAFSLNDNFNAAVAVVAPKPVLVQQSTILISTTLKNNLNANVGKKPTIKIWHHS